MCLDIVIPSIRTANKEYEVEQNNNSKTPLKVPLELELGMMDTIEGAENAVQEVNSSEVQENSENVIENEETTNENNEDLSFSLTTFAFLATSFAFCFIGLSSTPAIQTFGLTTALGVLSTGIIILLVRPRSKATS